jgi:dTDP-4-dehydrorhamnose 3,5-epimerase
LRLVETSHPEVKIVEPVVHGDARGFFVETWNARQFTEAGIDASFVQDNQSRSARGVLRGLHYQVAQPQGKLIRIAAGRAYDVAVDVRRGSPRFGQWVGVELSAANQRQLWVPAGFAHGFLALEDGTDLLYKCTAYYAPEHERSILWSDPEIGIAWPLEGIAAPTISARDAAALPLVDADVFP